MPCNDLAIFQSLKGSCVFRGRNNVRDQKWINKQYSMSPCNRISHEWLKITLQTHTRTRNCTLRFLFDHFEALNSLKNIFISWLSYALSRIMFVESLSACEVMLKRVICSPSMLLSLYQQSPSQSERYLDLSFVVANHSNELNACMQRFLLKRIESTWRSSLLTYGGSYRGTHFIWI